MGSGMSLIELYTGQIFKIDNATSFENYVYLTMLMQAYGVGIRLEASR
jgi:hypothetical protein